MKEVNALIYTALVFNENNQPIDKLPISIQFYDVQQQRWQVVQNTQIVSGKLSHTIALQPRLRGAMIKLRNMLNSECIPLFRIINVGNKDVVSYVFTPILSEKRDSLTIDFGQLWYYSSEVLKKYQIQNTSQFYGLPFWFDLSKSTNQGDDLARITRVSGTDVRILDTALTDVRKIELDQKEVERFRTIERDNIKLREEINTFQNSIQGKNLELNDLRKQYDKLVVDAVDYQKQIDVLNSRLENTVNTQEDKDSKAFVSIAASRVYEDISREIDTAFNNTSNNRFVLSNVSLNLKTVATDDQQGFKLGFVTPDSIKEVDSGIMSDLKINFTRNADAARNSMIAPKVIGLTETAARQLLGKYGLNIYPVYQKITSHPQGQAFKQTPEQGQEVNAQDTITVIFAK